MKTLLGLTLVLPLFLSPAGQAQSLPMTSLESPLVEQAPHCRKSFPTLSQMKAELEALSQTAPLVNTGVGGLALQNENQQLAAAYRELTTYKTYQARPQTEIDFWHLFKDSSCRKALCGIEKVYGPERGPLYLYVMTKYGLNLSHLGYDRLRAPTPADQPLFESYFFVRSWELSELPPYLRAIFELPENQLPVFPTRMTHSGIAHRENPNIVSNGIIQFYTPIDTKTDMQKERTTYHEIAHALGTSRRLDTSPEWIRISGWVLIDGKPVQPNKNGLVTQYAGKDLFEDFAESFVYYRYEPETLLALSPERYQYMKDKVFGGREYLKSLSCP